jgi:hypothetical protein
MRTALVKRMLKFHLLGCFGDVSSADHRQDIKFNLMPPKMFDSLHDLTKTARPRESTRLVS